MDLARLPPKLYFRIGEVAELVGVQPHVLRYWEREFRTIRPTKSARGQRVYSRRDVENLMRVRDLLYRERFTIAGARKKLKVADPLLEREAGAADDASAGEAGPVESVAAADSGGARSGAPRASSEASAGRAASAAREALLAVRADIRAFLAEFDPPVH